MTEKELHRLEYLDSVEFPIPEEFEELRALLRKQSEEYAKSLQEDSSE